MTIDNSEEAAYLFDDKELISSEVQSVLPPGYILRPLNRDDDRRGFLNLLSQLSVVGHITQASYQDRFDLIRKTGSTYIVVIESEERIVACATLLLEHKFLHECNNVGHIEDVVVDESQRGKKLGIRLIDALHFIAEKLDCYKTILNCNEAKVGFYERCQLKKTDVQMTRYFHK